jgi:PTS system glucose-specific IIA component
VSLTHVFAPVEGRALPLSEVPDPVFSQGMVGYGAAVDPPHQVIYAVAPVSGKILKLLPHAYVIMTPDNVGVLVHLGLDTVQLNGEGFTAHVAQGDTVEAGQPANIEVTDPVSTGAQIDCCAHLFTANK